MSEQHHRDVHLLQELQRLRDRISQLERDAQGASPQPAECSNSPVSLSETPDSEQRFRQLAEHIEEVFWISTHDKRQILYVSPGYEKTFGRSCDSLYRHARAFLDAVHPEDRSQLEAELAREADENWEHEYRIVRPDGAVRWIWSRVFPIRDAQGRVQRVAGVSQDITERKLAVQRLQERQHFIQHVTEAAPFVLYVFDLLERRNVYTNNQSTLLLGYTPDEIRQMGSKLLELVHPEDAEAVYAHLEKVAKAPDERVIEQEYRIQHADGKWRWLHCRDVVFERDAEGRVRQILGTAHDITRRKQAEEALEQSESRLRSITSNAPDFIVVADRDLKITFTGGAFSEGDRYRVRGSHLFDWIPEAAREQVRGVMDRVFQEGESQQFETIAYAPEGPRWYSCRVGAITSGERVTNAVLVARDISQQKRQQAELEAERTLLRRLLELHDRERQLVAYEIHDAFVQDVTGAQLSLEAVHFQLQQQGQPAQILNELEQVSARLRKAICEARMMISKLRPLIIDEQGIVAALEYLAAEEMSRAELEVAFRHEGQFNRLLPLLEGTLFRIAQEALNNVRRHSGARQAEVVLEQKNRHLCLEVRDWGKGFDPERIPKDRFGLRGICERARLFGGRAEIDSRPGEGTCIRVELPLDEQHRALDDSRDAGER